MNRAERRARARCHDRADELLEVEVCACAPVGVFVLLECGTMMPAAFTVEPEPGVS